jgi:hypothetical protein
MNENLKRIDNNFKSIIRNVYISTNIQGKVGEYVPEKYVLFDIMVINQRTATLTYRDINVQRH